MFALNKTLLQKLPYSLRSHLSTKKEICKSHRPMSIIPILVKKLKFDILLKTRLADYLKKYKLLNNFQHGYRTGKSTIIAKSDAFESNLDAFENRELRSAKFCDFWFCDFLHCDHKILIEKLQYYGI